MPTPTAYQYVKKDGTLGDTNSSDYNNLPADAKPNSGIIKNPPGVGGTPPPPTKPDPITTSPVRRYKQTDGGYGVNSTKNKLSTAYGDLKLEPVDEDKIRSDMRRNAQGQIDAIDRVYDTLVADERMQGEAALGRTRATQARSGNLGSDFGAGALGRTEQETQRLIGNVEARRASAIAAVLSGVEDRAQARLKADQEELRANRSEYIDYLKGVAEDSRKDVISLAKSGVSYDTLDDEQYTNLLDQTGFTPEELKAQFILNKPDEDILYKSTQGSKYVQVSRNPITGEVKSETFDLGFEVPAEYDPTTLADGRLLFVPKGWNGDTTKLITYGPQSASYLKGLEGDKPEAYTIPKTNRNNLLKAGMSSENINALEKDIQSYGLQTVLEGLDTTTRDVLQRELDKDFAITQ